MTKKSYILRIIKNLNNIDSELFLREIKKNTNHYKQAQISIQTKQKNWYNKRVDDDGIDTNKWEYQTKKYLEEFKKTNSKLMNPIFDKIWRSRFGLINLFESGYPRNMDQIYISDYIMFNQNCEITFDLMDRVLPYIKFKIINNDTIQIDRWIYRKKGFYIDGSNIPNYEIEYSDKELNSNEYIKTEYDKWLVVRAMLQIMNDTPNEFINLNSYQVIGHWYNKNDSWLVSWQLNN